MLCPDDARQASSVETPALEVAEIFRVHGPAYRQTNALSFEQRKVMENIEACRTAALGGHLDICADCGHQRPSYNSCRDRHCPKCQGLAQARWIEQRKARLLPIHYFHLVFTLPAELRSLARCNPRQLFGLLFQKAAETLLELGADERHLGARLGITAVLHTWTRELDFHPHVHCVVTGGGLAGGPGDNQDGSRWVRAKPRFLFPVKVLSRLFRGKLLAALRRAYSRGDLECAGGCAELAEPERFETLVNRLACKEWVVYAKRPFGGPEHVFEYLGRYTHRVAISNQRLVAGGPDRITFATKGGKTCSLRPHEFIRRFLMHVLPRGFTKIRHYGLHASSNVNTKLRRAQALLEPTPASPATAPEPPACAWAEHLEQLTGVDVSVCPRCHAAPMLRYAVPIRHGASIPLGPGEPLDSS